MSKRSFFLATLLGLGACDPGCTPTDDGGVTEGAGILVRDGVAQDYTVNNEESELLLLVRLLPRPGCSAFHSHVVEATSYGMEFNLDVDSPETSTFHVDVAAAGLRPDRNELRLRYPETKDVEMSDTDRAAIQQSVYGEVEASDHPTLVFAVSDMSGLDGAGLTAKVDVDIAGATSQLTFTYDAAFDGENLVIEGTGLIDGEPHGMPRSLSAAPCIDSTMEMMLKLVLEPGTNECGRGCATDGGAVEVFEPTTFPSDGGCGDEYGFDEVRDILGQRCMGCHSDPPRFTASEPLVEYADFRVDSVRHRDVPLYETAAELIALPLDDNRHMPPAEYTQLSEEEQAVLVAWAEAGAPETRCEPGPGSMMFTSTMQSTCGSPNYLEDIAPIIENNGCTFCHASEDTPDRNPELAPLASYSDGLAPSEHPYFEPLVIWESAYWHIVDGAMPPEPSWGEFYHPAGEGGPEAGIALFGDWISGGYPEGPCQ